MSKAEERALKAFPDYKIIDGRCVTQKNERSAYKAGYQQAEKDVTEAFARIIRGNLSMIDKSVQDKFEQLYIEITNEKMYKGFKD